MKALTICQPYAHLIMLPESHPEHKRVENRTWPTSYRGIVLIHAGKSKDWLNPHPDGVRDCSGIPLADMAFGAIVGVAELGWCMTVEQARVAVRPELRWLREHKHAEGPFCFVLRNILRFATPIAYRGAQGFFNVPDEIVAEQLAKARAMNHLTHHSQEENK